MFREVARYSLGPSLFVLQFRCMKIAKKKLKIAIEVINTQSKLELLDPIGKRIYKILGFNQLLLIYALQNEYFKTSG